MKLNHLGLLCKSYIDDFADDLKYNSIFGWEVIPKHYSLSISDIRLDLDKETGTYFAQAIHYPDIFASANNLDILLESFHGTANYYFGNSKYTARKTERFFELSEKSVEKLNSKGTLIIHNPQPKYATTNG